MQNVGEFKISKKAVSDGSHRIRTPLSIIKMELQILLKSKGQGADQKNISQSHDEVHLKCLKQIHELECVIEEFFNQIKKR
jgi:signal transduction histidine kinase